MNKENLLKKIKNDCGLDDTESYFLTSIGNDFQDEYEDQTADNVSESILEAAEMHYKHDPDTSLEEYITWVQKNGLAWCTMEEHKEYIEEHEG